MGRRACPEGKARRRRRTDRPPRGPDPGLCRRSSEARACRAWCSSPFGLPVARILSSRGVGRPRPGTAARRPCRRCRAPAAPEPRIRVGARGLGRSKGPPGPWTRAARLVAPWPLAARCARAADGVPPAPPEGGSGLPVGETPSPPGARGPEGARDSDRKPPGQRETSTGGPASRGPCRRAGGPESPESRIQFGARGFERSTHSQPFAP